MKRILLLLAPVLLLAVMASCTKEGPQGPVGPEGPTGPEGPQGESGEVTCNQCHTESEDMMIKSKEWSMSNHATNTFLADRGGDYGGGSCNMCHSSQGFQDHIATGNTAGVLENPLNPNCYTCHKIHDTYTSADWEMRKTDC